MDQAGRQVINLNVTSLKQKHPLAIRWAHWINFPLLFLMIWSGLMIYWANDVYRIGLGRTTLLHFFPDWFFKLFALQQRLADGMALHFLFMWFFAVNGILYVCYLALSGEWRHVFPDRRSFREAILVTLHDLHLTKSCPPQGKYNGAQKLAYTAIMLIGAASLITGLAIYKPVQLMWLTELLGGYEWARWEHFWITVAFLLFFAIHVAQVIKAGWNNFRSMVSGYELKPVEERPRERS